uniref:Uncharacterized protein n=1 Tax=Mustela putorius furo TaxID=9669 RepID=M3XZM2_MUSPF
MPRPRSVQKGAQPLLLQPAPAPPASTSCPFPLPLGQVWHIETPTPCYPSRRQAGSLPDRGPPRLLHCNKWPGQVGSSPATPKSSEAAAAGSGGVTRPQWTPPSSPPLLHRKALDARSTAAFSTSAGGNLRLGDREPAGADGAGSPSRAAQDKQGGRKFPRSQAGAARGMLTWPRGMRGGGASAAHRVGTRDPRRDLWSRAVWAFTPNQRSQERAPYHPWTPHSKEVDGTKTWIPEPEPRVVSLSNSVLRAGLPPLIPTDGAPCVHRLGALRGADKNPSPQPPSTQHRA